MQTFQEISFFINKTLTFNCYSFIEYDWGIQNMFKILVVEDDEKLNQSVCLFLRQYGFEAIACHDAYEAYDEMYGNLFDLILSDIMMPDIDGFEFAETVRKLNQDVPILFMTARDDIGAKQRGFRAGIDDYMVKPVDFEELHLRIQAILRRSKIAQNKKVVIGSITVDAEEHTVYKSNEEIPLTVREFNLLYKLLSYPKKTFTRAQLMDEFWDIDTETSPRSVDVYMTKLRDKFSDCDDFSIVTVHGLGYKAVLKDG